tara:strand:- start:6052 stop:6321 length:270 start_codon:yes stop_codon:yes gene_type:complete
MKSFKQLNEAVADSEADLMLVRGEKYILKQDRKDYDRGLIVHMNENGSYDVQYWYNEAKAYPVEVLVDGVSVKKDAKTVRLNFHPKLDK